MRGALTSLAAEALLKHFVGKETFTKPTALWIGLFSTVPSALSSGLELPTTSGGNPTGYARKEIDEAKWEISSSQTITHTATVWFDTALTDWDTVAALGVFDAATAGNLLWFAEFEIEQTVEIGKAMALSSLSLSITTTE